MEETTVTNEILAAKLDALGFMLSELSKLIGELKPSEQPAKPPRAPSPAISPEATESLVDRLADLAADDKARIWVSREGDRVALNRKAVYKAIDSERLNRNAAFDALAERGLLKRDSERKNTCPVRRKGKVVRGVVIYNYGVVNIDADERED